MARYLTTLIILLTLLVPARTQDGRLADDEARREQWQKVGKILEAMAIGPGAVVADIGAGGGFFTSQLSRAVGEQGLVYAVDIDPGALGRLRARVAADRLWNVEVVEGAENDPMLPEGLLDAALIVNAYHEMTAPQAVLDRIRAALKPDGRLVIIEPIARSRRSDPRAEQIRHHEIGPEFVRQEAREAGFTLVRLQDPFTTRPDRREEEWILVLTPANAQSDAWASRSADWKAPELRITPEAFKRPAAAAEVLVLDVRDPESYRRGRLPGAVLMTPEDFVTGSGLAKLAGETRPIVTYCS